MAFKTGSLPRLASGELIRSLKYSMRTAAVCKGCKCGIALVVASGSLPDHTMTSQGRSLGGPRHCAHEKESNRLPFAEGRSRQILTAQTQAYSASENKQTLCPLGNSAGRCDRMTQVPENTARKTGSGREADRRGTALGLRSRYILICILVWLVAMPCRMLSFSEVRHMTTSTSLAFCGHA